MKASCKRQLELWTTGMIWTGWVNLYKSMTEDHYCYGVFRRLMFGNVASVHGGISVGTDCV
jgi:hypothetical protein